MKDGLSEIEGDIPFVVTIIARTALWVHPETFRALPVWCPDTARGLPVYDARWSRHLVSRKGAPKKEANIRAAGALCEALGLPKRRPKNWTVCHIWGFDDEKFASKSHVVQDRRYYSCVGNMILLPTPLKGFTDVVPLVKEYLRVCAFHMYGWTCEHEVYAAAAEQIKSGKIPAGYPNEWPTSKRRSFPLGTAKFDAGVRSSIAKRKARIKRELEHVGLKHYPREAVCEVLRFWKVDLEG
jgi:hypothetical protein